MFQIIPRRALVEPTVRVSNFERSGDTSAVTLQIEGLLCSLCVTHVENQLTRVEGVSEANVNLNTEEATVCCEATTNPGDLMAAVESAVVLRPVRRLLAKLGGAV